MLIFISKKKAKQGVANLFCFLPLFQLNKPSLRPRKKETLFYGRMVLPSRIGWSGHFFKYFFFFLVAKSASPKDTKISKKKKKKTFFEKILEKYFHLFWKIFSQIFFDFGYKRLICTWL